MELIIFFRNMLIFIELKLQILFDIQNAYLPKANRVQLAEESMKIKQNLGCKRKTITIKAVLNLTSVVDAAACTKRK